MNNDEAIIALEKWARETIGRENDLGEIGSRYQQGSGYYPTRSLECLM